MPPCCSFEPCMHSKHAVFLAKKCRMDVFGAPLYQGAPNKTFPSAPICVHGMFKGGRAGTWHSRFVQRNPPPIRQTVLYAGWLAFGFWWTHKKIYKFCIDVFGIESVESKSYVYTMEKNMLFARIYQTKQRDDFFPFIGYRWKYYDIMLRLSYTNSQQNITGAVVSHMLFFPIGPFGHFTCCLESPFWAIHWRFWKPFLGHSLAVLQALFGPFIGGFASPF